MARRYERQPDKLPTNKASVAGVIAPLVALNCEPVIAELWPQLVLPVLAGQAVTTFVSGMIGALAGLALAWYVPDRAGITVYEE